MEIGKAVETPAQPAERGGPGARRRGVLQRSHEGKAGFRVGRKLGYH